jgi:hypothetical protein
VPGYGQIDVDYAARLASREPEDDGPVFMLNLMAYKAEADYGPGGETGVSGREADDRYAPLDVLASIGASVCFFGDVVASTEGWDRVAVVRYPTRKSFIDMQSRPDFQARHVHKEAGMERTIIMAALPVAGLPSDGAPALTLVEAWTGDPPPADGAATDFTVEGTIVGDGRTWRAVRFSPASADEELADRSAQQALVVRPFVTRWS